MDGRRTTDINRPNELQDMLNKTNEIANHCHIEFGKEKNKILKIGPSIQFNSNLLLLYSVQSEINFRNRYTYGECYDLQLIGSWSYWYDSTSFR